MIRIVVLVGLLFFSLTPPIFSSEQSKAKFDSAMSLYKNGQLQEAIEQAKESISLDPKVSVPYTFLGNVYNELKNSEEAEKYFKKAVEINPREGGALNGLGLLYSEKGLRDKAIEFFKKAMGAAPEYYGVHVNLGKEYILVFEKRGDRKYLELAKESLGKAVKLNANSYDAYSYLGKVFLALKEYEKAIENLEKSISLNPNVKERYYDDLSTVYYDLASAYYNKEQFREAIKNSLESLKIYPDAPDAIFLLGVSYLYSGNKEEANAQYLKLKKINIEMADRLKEEIERKRNASHKNEAIKSEQEFNDFTTYYYLSPQPDMAPQALNYFLSSKLFFRDNINTNGHVIEMFTYFFGRVADINPYLIREYEKYYDAEDKFGKSFLMNIFSIASDEQNKQFFKEKLTTETDNEMKDFLEKIIAMPPLGNKRIIEGVKDYNDLDFMWMEFFITGNKEPIVKLVDVLAREDRFKKKLLIWASNKHNEKETKDLNALLSEANIRVDLEKGDFDIGTDMDCMYSAYLNASGRNQQRSKYGIQIRQILGLSEEDLYYMATKGAAMWALQSNAKQHPKVLEYCKQEFERRNDKSKIELAIILEIASKGTIELVPTGESDRATLKLREENTEGLDLNIRN
jgi:tetratricopeptide (TPR) repeat protein